MNRERLAAIVGVAGTLLGGGGLAAGAVISGVILRGINAGLYDPSNLPEWVSYPTYIVGLGTALIFAALVLFYSD